MMPGGFSYALTEAHRNAHRATQGGRGIEILPDTQTPHREPQRAHRATPEKRPRDPPGAAPPPEWVSFRSLFVCTHPKQRASFSERDFNPFLEKALSASFLRKTFLLFLLNPSCFLSRFPRRHRVEARQPPRNQDNAVALLPGLLLRREGCSA